MRLPCEPSNNSTLENDEHNGHLSDNELPKQRRRYEEGIIQWFIDIIVLVIKPYIIFIIYYQSLFTLTCHASHLFSKRRFVRI